MLICKKLYSKHFDRYEKQEIRVFDQKMHLKKIQKEVIEKNLYLEQQVAQLHVNVDKLW